MGPQGGVHILLYRLEFFFAFCPSFPLFPILGIFFLLHFRYRGAT